MNLTFEEETLLNEYINQSLSKNDIIFALSTIESDYDDLISIANSLLNKLKSIKDSVNL